MGIYTPLVLDDDVEKAFYHGLRTNGFVILAGQTGTGKTRLFHEFKVYECEDEFIWLLKNSFVNGDTYWKKIDKFRKWIVKTFSSSSFTIENYWVLYDPDRRYESLCLKLRGVEDADGSNEWIKKIFPDLGKFDNYKFRAYIGGDRFYLLSSELYSEYSSSYRFDGEERERLNAYKLKDFDEVKRFFKDILSPILKKLAEYVNHRNPREIIRDEELNNFFSRRVLKFFAFIANPYRYGEIFDVTEIEQIKRSLDPQGNLRQRYQELCERGELDYDKAVEKQFFPIRPDLTEPHHLVGHFNPLDKKYYPTELVRFILKAIEKYLKIGKDARPYLVLFDEMNIAQVEYYFADFLSVLETPRIKEPSKESRKIEEFKESLKELEREKLISLKDIDLGNIEKFEMFTSEGITLFNLPAKDSSSEGSEEESEDTPQPKTVKILLPPNLYFVGTVNMDETTRSFSPKVLDRAFVIEFDSDLEEFINHLSPQNTQEVEGGSPIAESANDGGGEPIHVCKDDFTRCGKFFGVDGEKIREFISENGENIQKLKEIHKSLKRYGLHFGYRTFEHVIMFIINARDTKHEMLKIDEIKKALDIAIYSKVLPKFSGPRPKLERALNKLLIELCNKVKKEGNDGKFFCENDQLLWKPIFSSTPSERKNHGSASEERSEPVGVESLPGKKEDKIVKVGNYEIETNYPLTVKKIFEMLYRLQTEGFASFL